MFSLQLYSCFSFFNFNIESVTFLNLQRLKHFLLFLKKQLTGFCSKVLFLFFYGCIDMNSLITFIWQCWWSLEQNIDLSNSFLSGRIYTFLLLICKRLLWSTWIRTGNTFMSLISFPSSSAEGEVGSDVNVWNSNQHQKFFLNSVKPTLFLWVTFFLGHRRTHRSVEGRKLPPTSSGPLGHLTALTLDPLLIQYVYRWPVYSRGHYIWSVWQDVDRAENVGHHWELFHSLLFCFSVALEMIIIIITLFI